MKSFAAISAIALSLLPYVAAHGYVPQITVDGKVYKGPGPGKNSNSQSVIRQVTGVDPSYGANNGNLNCGPGAQPAALSASANPGSTVSFTWHEWTDGRKWPHNTGGRFTYMASCGNVECSKFDSKKAKWFKIDEFGKKNGVWGQADLYAGKSVSVTIPSTLAPGNYLIMHQLISLHLVDSAGAEYYASCSQLKVGGSQTGAPSADELVSMPGGYTDSEPGIKASNLYSGAYTNPGPKISKLASTASPVEGETPSDEPVKSEEPVESYEPSATASASTPVKSNTNSGGCKKPDGKKKEASIAETNATEYRPRHVSRVMRSVGTDFSASRH